MKRVSISLLVLLCSLLFQSGAIAQNKPLACQVDAAAGLEWENGRWITARFVRNNFILVQAGNNLTNESVAKVLNVRNPKHITCRYTDPEITCFDPFGQTLFFDPTALRGGKSRLLGSTSVGSERDSVVVEVFSCTPF